MGTPERTNETVEVRVALDQNGDRNDTLSPFVSRVLGQNGQGGAPDEAVVPFKMPAEHVRHFKEEAQMLGGATREALVAKLSTIAHPSHQTQTVRGI